MRAILTYHSIDDSGSPVSVSPQAFRAHVRFLASGRVAVVPLAELWQMRDGEDAVSITFDDGFANVAREALPLLAEHALPSTIFVVTGHIGGMNDWGGLSHDGIPTLPLMSWEMLGAARDDGAEVGAHTRRHADLTTLAPGALEEELSACAESIATNMGVLPSTFAYPFGRVSPAVASAVREVYDLACTTELRALSADDDAVLLPRLDSYYLREPGQLESWGTAAFRSRLWLRAQGRRVRGMVFEGGGVW
jgi:peptidoglycan/xylan/chitin deacetylase (PgdA/CDA1 family)